MAAIARDEPDRFSADRRGPAPPELLPIQEFVNTRDTLTGRDALETPEELHAFLAARGLLEAVEVVAPADQLTARRTREAVRSFLAHSRGHLTDAEVELLDDIGRRAQLQWEFSTGGRIGLVARRRGVIGALGTLLAPLLTAGVTGTLDRLKTCRNCDWAFYDRSKNRSGAWCSMELCGSRSKAKRHYWRSRAEAAPDE
jgi:predicted RNA-binding Zn ribbon-like protein